MNPPVRAPRHERAGVAASRCITGSVLVSIALFLAGAGAQAAQPTKVYEGRPLAAVLRELRDAGLDLIFSSAVVPETLRVTVEPASSEPRELLDEILAPLNLEARNGPAGTLLILPVAGAGTAIRGTVVNADHGAGIRGATIRVRGAPFTTVSGADGRFELPGVPPGVYDLEIEADGFLPATVARIRLSPKSEAEWTVRLRPQPAFATEVIVTPAHHSVVQQEQAATRAFDREEIVLAPAIGNDITRVVELLPGVTSPGSSAGFSVRGSLIRDTAMYLDGLELYEPYHLESFLSPFSLIDRTLIDRVDFMAGGFTVEYGDRHGSIVELTTGLPADRGGGAVELGTLNSRVAYGAPLSGARGSWLASVRAWYPETLVESVEVGSGERLRPRFGDAYGKVSLSLSPRTILSVHGLLATDRLKYNEQGETINESVDSAITNRNFWVRVLHLVSEAVHFETVVSAGRIESERDGVSVPGESSVAVRDDRRVDYLGIRYDLAWQISGARLFKAGLLARRLQSQYRYALVDEGAPDASTSNDLDPEGASVALYAAYRARFASSVAAELGVRWDRQDYTDDNQLSPRFNLYWQAGERSELRFAVGRFHQSQRIHELNVQDGETTFERAEVSQQVELSFRHRLVSGLRFRVDAYYRRLSDLQPRWENLFRPVELFPETIPDRVKIAPTGGRLQGVELLLAGDPRRPLTWWVGFTLSSAEDIVSSEEAIVDGERVPRSWDQPYAGKFLVGYRWDDRWMIALSGTAHTGWPTTPVTGEWVVEEGTPEIVPVPGPRNSARYPTYARLDFKASRSFRLRGSRLSLLLDVVNLTDRKNACCVDEFLFDPQPDGSIAVDTIYDYWLGFTPSFSILWQF